MVESEIERQPEEVVDWCACPLSPYLFSGRGPKSPGREQNAQQIGVNRLATSILNARFIVWRQTPARYNWPLIRVRQKVNSSLGQVHPHSFALILLPPNHSSFFVRVSYGSTLLQQPLLLSSFYSPSADLPVSVTRPDSSGVSPSRVRNGVIDGFPRIWKWWPV